MKFLLVLLVLLVAVWIWRSNRRPDVDRAARAERKAIDMAVCDLCGVHCAKTDMVPGLSGSYCSVQHRDQAEV